jgi:chaperone LolA
MKCRRNACGPQLARRSWVRWLLLLGLFAAVPAGAVPAPAITGAAVMQLAQTRLARCRTISSSFEKRFYWAALDRTTTYHGKLYLRRPDCFRVEVDDGSLIVADGATVWVYNRRNGQAIANPYHGEVLTPWDILADFQSTQVPDSVASAALGGRACHLLTLVPRQGDGSLLRTRVWIGQRDSLLLQVEQVDLNEDVTTYTLKNHRANAALNDRLFRFVPPAGTQIIDRRTGAGEPE